MKQLKKTLNFAVLAVALLSLTFFSGCIKEPVDNPTTSEGNAYVLNEGMWGGNDAELSLLNTSTGAITNNYFSAGNGRGLGDVAQDANIYGGKLYVAVYASNTLEVINVRTGKSIKQIDFGQRGPRSIVSHNGKIYVSCYDKSVVRIDTAQLSIEATCALSGMQPEGLCVSGNKLYVCNSWQYASNGDYIYDSTISVINLSSFNEEKKITVATNPSKIKTLSDGRLVVCYYGNYANISAGLAIVNPTTESVNNLDVAASNFDIYNDNIYLYNYSYTTQQTTFWKINAATLTKTQLLQNCSVSFVSPYGLNVNSTTGDIYVTDSRNYQSSGDVYCFTSAGTLRWSAEATNGPSKVVFF